MGGWVGLRYRVERDGVGPGEGGEEDIPVLSDGMRLFGLQLEEHEGVFVEGGKGAGSGKGM